MKFNIDKIKVGERIFNIRNSLNLTLEQFGKDPAINAERSNVSKWERGATLPNKARLEVIAKKGNMTVNELLYGSPKEFVNNNINVLLSNLDGNTGFFSKILNILDISRIKLHLEEVININNLTDVAKLFKKVVDRYFSKIKSDNVEMINYLKRNYELSVDTFNILYGGGYFGDITTYELNRYLNERNIDIPTEDDIKDIKITKDFDSFIKLFDDDFINFKFKELLEDFYLKIKDKQSDFQGNYYELYFISIDFETFKNLPHFYDFKGFYEATRKSKYFVDSDSYIFPYKPNKYKISNFNDVIGLYMNDTDTTYFLANYLSIKKVPLNTEALYFILNHDNTYQITKITELPDCKYIAPIIGKLE